MTPGAIAAPRRHARRRVKVARESQKLAPEKEYYTVGQLIGISPDGEKSVTIPIVVDADEVPEARA